ncbi:MAG: thiamine phosphate synthase [Planctomycetota bacterium]
MAGGLTALFVTAADGEVEDVLGAAGRALQGGVSAILVRRPHSSAREVYNMTRHLRPATRRSGCHLLVSDRIDAALAADADGVHLGARSMPTAAARTILRPGMMLGCSTHNLDEATAQQAAGADYLFLGPIFATPSHPAEPGLGVEHLREAVLRTRIPIIAIGGVTAETVPLVVQAGAAGAAAISAYSRSPDPAEVARLMRAAFAR